MRKPRRNHSASFKARVALDVARRSRCERRALNVYANPSLRIDTKLSYGNAFRITSIADTSNSVLSWTTVTGQLTE